MSESRFFLMYLYQILKLQSRIWRHTDVKINPIKFNIAFQGRFYPFLTVHINLQNPRFTSKGINLLEEKHPLQTYTLSEVPNPNRVKHFLHFDTSIQGAIY